MTTKALLRHGIVPTKGLRIVILTHPVLV